MKKGLMCMILAVCMLLASATCFAVQWIPLSEDIGPGGFVDAYNDMSQKLGYSSRVYDYEQSGGSDPDFSCNMKRGDIRSTIHMEASDGGYLKNVRVFVIDNDTDAMDCLIEQYTVVCGILGLNGGEDGSNAGRIYSLLSENENAGYSFYSQKHQRNFYIRVQKNEINGQSWNTSTTIEIAAY